MAKTNNLRKEWIDQSLADQISRLAERMQGELGDGKKSTASRLLANSIQKAGLVEGMEFVKIPKTKKKSAFLYDDQDSRWGFKI